MSDRDKLHAAIMNLYLPEGWDYEFSQGMRLAYKVGHRDARRAAAELVSAAWSARDSEVERLREALTKISTLDPETDSDEGFNEWGEAECFNKAQDIARAALLSSQDKESA